MYKEPMTRHAILQRMLGTKKGIRNNSNIVENVTTSITHHAQMCIQVMGRQ
jgi:hypothetical protein